MPAGKGPSKPGGLDVHCMEVALTRRLAVKATPAGLGAWGLGPGLPLGPTSRDVV